MAVRCKNAGLSVMIDFILATRGTASEYKILPQPGQRRLIRNY